MALLGGAHKRRIVGSLVLVALAVIFLPMMFSRQDEQHQVFFDAPDEPQVPAMPQVLVDTVVVPLLQVFPEKKALSSNDELDTPAPNPEKIQLVAPGNPDTGKSRIDRNGLPISWSIQLASFSSHERAETLQNKLRSQGYRAYIRSAGGRSRVLVGMLIERDEADRLRDLLGRQQHLNGFVLRFQP